MKRYLGILFLSLVLASCVREKEEPFPACYPEGTPVTMYIPFGTPDFYDVQIGTKAEASRADETRIHELYVMLFDNDGNRFYNRNFSYIQKYSKLHDTGGLVDHTNEGWYVETDNSGVSTRGVVKLSTISRSNCTLVVIANVTNTITTLDGQTSAVDYLAGITKLSDLKKVKVTLSQFLVTRSDLFLMVGHRAGINTGELEWGTVVNSEDYYYSTTSRDGDPAYEEAGTSGHKYQIELKPLVAKVKFRIRYDNTNIDPSKSYSRNWVVNNVPTSCYLFEPDDDADGISRQSNLKDYFVSLETYFDGTEADDNGTPLDTTDDLTWEVFTFYIFENYQDKLQAAGNYYDREKQQKNVDSQHSGYWSNGDWLYAPAKGTYVWFDMVLGLKSTGVESILNSANDPQNQSHIAQAITSKAAFTVHLGDFTSSQGSGNNYDDYSVKRGNCYTYNITIENTTKIYVEVVTETQEDEPAQEGSLLLVTEGIVNCDAHYEYHSLVFEYDPAYLNAGISWYVKTPFSSGGDGECKDYLWVKFAVNDIDGTAYSVNRKQYPVRPAPGGVPDPDWVPYDPSWDKTGTPPPLMDIKQLVSYIVRETQNAPNGSNNDYRLDNDPASPTYGKYVIRVTAFVDEYYYGFDPLDYDPYDPAKCTIPDPDPELWRKFVNQPPRELHILSNTRYSKDRQSDVILANNSIIQQSIQTFYNIYSPDLSSIWGVEHLDEMEYRTRVNKDGSQGPWPWWKDGKALPSGGTPNNESSGRENTAIMWGLKSGSYQYWDNFMNYSVNNNTPELQNDLGEHDYQYLAYSCLTRNRDNNNNGIIDENELRWYTASIDQLIGMWVGNESLSLSARLYHPMNAKNKTDGTQWRSWVISSTASSIANPAVIRAEEGCTKSDHTNYSWAFGNNDAIAKPKRDKVSSIRCVRNIGTYLDGGKIIDFSEAPYDKEVDKWYVFPEGEDANGKIMPNADNTYTVSFSRLNPKSIREYTEEALPFHNEYSMHNCVYQELNIQDKNNYVYADGSFPQFLDIDDDGSKGDDEPALDLEYLNKDITETGHNLYCPEGYRLPNMTELLLMKAFLPTTYWSSNKVYPCRTFYTHGKLGDDKDQVDSELNKLGWQHSTVTNRVNIIDVGQTFGGIRCVRDVNCTGIISGKLTVEDGNNLEYAIDAGTSETILPMTLSLNVSSLGSAIKSMDFYLEYISPSGAEETVPLEVIDDLELSGVTFRDDVRCKLSSEYCPLPVLGNMNVCVDVKNYASNTAKILEAPIHISSPVFTSVRLLHCEYDEEKPNPSFPILLTASSPTFLAGSDPKTYTINSWRLKVVNPDGLTTNIELPGQSDKYHWSQCYQYTYRTRTDDASQNVGLGPYPPVLQTGTYTFQLEVVYSEYDNPTPAQKITLLSDIASMEVLKVNYWPNPTDPDIAPYDANWDENPSYPYADATAITNKWTAQQITDMDFYSGDFIEANMDVSACYYKVVYKTGTTNRDDNTSIWRDNLISVGVTGTDTGNSFSVANVFHFNYPSHDSSLNSNQDWLYPNITKQNGTSNPLNYNSFLYGEGTGFALQSSKAKPVRTAKQHFRIEQSGSYWNDQLIRFSNWGANADNAQTSFNAILNSNTLYVGSTQGYHRSRAGYMFVRAVHNSASKNNTAGNTGFSNNPQKGEDL